MPKGVVQDYIFPFDLNVLSQQDSPEVEYAKMRENLHQHYSPEMIPGFAIFQSKTYAEMVQKFGDAEGNISPFSVFEKVNAFREKQGRKPLSFGDHSKLFTYNEAVFLKPVHMEPQAIFGTSQEAKYRSKKYSIPLYPTAADFYLAQLEEKIATVI